MVDGYSQTNQNVKKQTAIFFFISKVLLDPPPPATICCRLQPGRPVVVLMVLRWTGDWSYLCIIERGICVTLAFSLRYQQTPAHQTRVIEYIPYTQKGSKKDTTRRRTCHILCGGRSKRCVVLSTTQWWSRDCNRVAVLQRYTLLPSLERVTSWF